MKTLTKIQPDRSRIGFALSYLAGILVVATIAGCQTGAGSAVNIDQTMADPIHSPTAPEDIRPAFGDEFAANEAPHTLMIKPVAKGVMTSGHGYRLSPTGEAIPRKHKGVDYAAPKGTKIFAAGDGVVEKMYRSKSYGNYIVRASKTIQSRHQARC